MLCPWHGRCARYAAVTFSDASARTLATCRSGESFPLFVAITPPLEEYAAAQTATARSR